MKKLIWITLIVVLLGGCAWFSLVYLAWQYPPPKTHSIALADLDADGDLDAFIGSDKQGRIWLNDGRGSFTESRQEINYSSRHAATLGDVDGDGTLDVVAAKLDSALVWFNDGTSQMHK